MWWVNMDEMLSNATEIVASLISSAIRLFGQLIHTD